MKRTQFLLYRPVLDYEESIKPLCIFTSRRTALKALNTLLAWGNEAFNDAPEKPDSELPDDEWEKKDSARRDYFNSLKPPFGVDMSTDLNAYSDRFEMGCLEVMELYSNPKP